MDNTKLECNFWSKNVTKHTNFKENIDTEFFISHKIYSSAFSISLKTFFKSKACLFVSN